MPCIVGVAISFRLPLRFCNGICKCFILCLCDEVAECGNAIADRNLGSGGVGICQIAAGNTIIKVCMNINHPRKDIHSRCVNDLIDVLCSVGSNFGDLPICNKNVGLLDSVTQTHRTILNCDLHAELLLRLFIHVT